MKKLVTFTKTSLREGIQKIEIETDNLDFKNGYAVAKALVSCYTLEKGFSGYKPKMYTFDCEGLINEKYEEAFNTNNKSNAAKYFMFLEETKKITRLKENYFIVESSCKEYGKYRTNFTFLGIHNKIPFVVQNNIQNFKETSTKDLVIINNQFYNLITSKFVGPKFESLEETKKTGIFEFIDRLNIPDESDYSYSTIELLTAKVYSDFTLYSDVYSASEGDKALLTNGIENYLEVREKRIKELKTRKTEFLSRYRFLKDSYK